MILYKYSDNLSSTLLLAEIDSLINEYSGPHCIMQAETPPLGYNSTVKDSNRCTGKGRIAASAMPNCLALDKYMRNMEMSRKEEIFSSFIPLASLIRNK